MPVAVASRVRNPGKGTKPAREAPPTKRTKLSQPAAIPRHHGLQALLHGSSGKKPAVSAKLNGVRDHRSDRAGEATAVVSGGHAGHGDVAMEHAGNIVIEISSGDEESDDFSSEQEGSEHAGAGAQDPAANGHADPEQPLEDGSAEPEEPTFGERLQAHEPEPEHDTRIPRVVDVESAFLGPDADSKALATATIKRPLAAPSATSLGTVLSQALRTNDQELLDSCVRVNDVDTVYATVERLPSSLVGILLQKLAERLHKGPGRPGMLMVWVQWSLSAHGGYLATQPQLVQQLATLHKVLKERASGLQPLLALKGRLDMLHTQLELRRRNHKRAAHDDLDEAVIYVEGEEEPSSDDEGDEGQDGKADMDNSTKQTGEEGNEDSESSVDEMPTTMEVDDDDSEEGTDDLGDLVDDEAEETDDDSGEELSDPISDDFENEEVFEVGENSRPTKRSTAGRAGLSRRN